MIYYIRALYLCMCVGDVCLFIVFVCECVGCAIHDMVMDDNDALDVYYCYWYS